MAEEPAVATRSRENTRARLLEAAFAVFAEVGLDAASVEAVCDRAGFTRGAFYSNFASKDDLFLAVIASFSEQKLAAITARVQVMTGQRAQGAQGAQGEQGAQGQDGARPPSPTEIVQQLVDMSMDTRQGVLLMSEIRIRAMRDSRMAAAYRAWHEGTVGRVTGIVDQLARVYGLRLRMPAREFAKVMLDVWEGTSVQAIIDGLDDAAAATAVSARTQALTRAVVEGFSE